MAEEIIQQLNDFCSIAEKNLSNLNGQLNKIIEIKKKMSKDAGNSMMLRQAGAALSTVDNLEKINSKLSEAISDLSVLHHNVRLLLRKQFGVQLDPSLDTKGSEPKEIKKDQA
jgi:DNA mismatch repair ATPase MutS